MSFAKKTKIVGTIGPASQNEEIIAGLIKNGLNLVRLNFSHGDYDFHKKTINMVREVSKKLDIPIALIQDIRGPKIRLGNVNDEGVLLKNGDEIELTIKDIKADPKSLPVDYNKFVEDVELDKLILIDDGLIELKPISKTLNSVKCKVSVGGLVKSRKGVNLPGVKVNLPPITKKDEEDIIFGIKNNIDYFAISFVRKAADIAYVKELLKENNADIPLIAKIENQEGLLNLDNILDVSDGIMVARGDLGVEIPTEDVPFAQKNMIRKCNEKGKPVITATQMLDSMIRNPRPTRAETTDVANAILDGTDAVMLSGETAAGKYPVESVKVMNKIALETERMMLKVKYKTTMLRIQGACSDSIAISHATKDIAEVTGAKAIVLLTRSGKTARLVSNTRPMVDIIAFTPDEQVVRRMQLNWGIQPFLLEKIDNTDVMIRKAAQKTIEQKIADVGDKIIITAGIPLSDMNNDTNMVKIHTVGK